MSHEPPTGIELKVARKLKKHTRTMSEIDSELGDGDGVGCYDIIINHAIEGVRCNGYQRLQSTARAFISLRGYVEETVEHAKTAKVQAARALEMLKEAKEDFSDLTMCSKCKGSGGWSSGTQGEDCSKCDGRGCYPKRVSR